MRFNDCLPTPDCGVAFASQQQWQTLCFISLCWNSGEKSVKLRLHDLITSNWAVFRLFFERPIYSQSGDFVLHGDRRSRGLEIRLNCASPVCAVNPPALWRWFLNDWSMRDQREREIVPFYSCCDLMFIQFNALLQRYTDFSGLCSALAHTT